MLAVSVSRPASNRASSSAGDAPGEIGHERERREDLAAGWAEEHLLAGELLEEAVEGDADESGRRELRMAHDDLRRHALVDQPAREITSATSIPSPLAMSRARASSSGMCL